MAKRVTIKDIASRTGTSVATVHRVLYGVDGVSEVLREKVLAEARRSNYRIDPTASLLRRKELHVTILLPDAAGPEKYYYQGLWKGIRQGVRNLGNSRIQFRYVKTDRGVSEISSALERLYDEADEDLDGLITICDDQDSRLWIQRFIRRGVRVALVDRSADIEGLTCSVETSSEDMAAIAVDLLGRYSLAKPGPLILVNGPQKRSSYRRYAETVRKDTAAIFPDKEILEIDGYQEEEGWKTLDSLLKNGACCGIIASCARGTMWTCRLLETLPKEKRPTLIGTDVYPELVPYFDSGILKASIYQSHLEHGDKAIRLLYDSFSDYKSDSEVKILGRLSIVTAKNCKYFLD